jgi:hypothetical protein
MLRNCPKEKQDMHSKFLEYLNADEPEGVGLAELRVPWITPRRSKEAEAGTLRACRATRKSMPPLVKYRAVNMPARIVATVVPNAEDSHVLHDNGLNPRGKTGCGACRSSHEGRGLRRGKVPVGEVSRLAEHGECMATDDVMWSLAHHALAKDGIERDKSMRPFFTDKFTGQRVYMLRQVERRHDIRLHDAKRTAVTPETARMPPSSTRASNPRTHQPGESQSASKIFSDIKEQLTNQQRVLDDRLQVQTRMPSFLAALHVFA